MGYWLFLHLKDAIDFHLQEDNLFTPVMFAFEKRKSFVKEDIENLIFSMKNRLSRTSKRETVNWL